MGQPTATCLLHSPAPVFSRTSPLFLTPWLLSSAPGSGRQEELKCQVSHGKASFQGAVTL
jgi:hypothetical protein